MLVLSRRPGEKVFIGDDVTLTVVQVDGNRVRLAIEAPSRARILRAELRAGPRDPAAGPAKTRPTTGPPGPG
jgi:carbon storage regulator